ncbi:hypothetical protein HN873_036004, partial [Arachis hypogaea]
MCSFESFLSAQCREEPFSVDLCDSGRKGNPAFAVSSAPDFSSHSAAVIPSLPLAAAFLRSVGIVLSL